MRTLTRSEAIKAADIFLGNMIDGNMQMAAALYDAIEREDIDMLKNMLDEVINLCNKIKEGLDNGKEENRGDRV